MFKVAKLLRIKSSLVGCARRMSFDHLLGLIKNLHEPIMTNLANGLRVVSEYRNTDLVCVGLFFDGGSRYESAFQNGTASFLEHVVFKSTRSRTIEALNAQMACTGARFKSFTTREMIGFYAECHFSDVPLIVDILSDCIYNNAFCQDVLEEQKEVVYQEMVDYENDVNRVMFDYLHKAAYMGTPLEQTVLGLSTNLPGYSGPVLSRYIEQYLTPSRSVLALVGGYSHKCLVELANNFLGRCEVPKSNEYCYRFSHGDIRYRNDDQSFAHMAIAYEAPGLCDDDSVVMDVAAAMLGGWDRRMPGGNLPANFSGQSCAAGVGDGYKTFYIKYQDAGLWGVAMTAQREEADSLLYNVMQELKRMSVSITEGEVSRAKNIAISRLLTELQTITDMCIDLGRYTLYTGLRKPLSERLIDIARVHREDILQYIDELVYDRPPAIAAVGSIEAMPEHNRILQNTRSVIR